MRRMQEAGLEPHMDEVANVYGRDPNAARTLLIGSHTDTVPQGGWLDGAMGVIYALEIARAGNEAFDVLNKRMGESLDEVRIKIQSILRKHSDRLSEAQKADIGRLVEEGQKSLEALRAFPLDNSDQPGNILRLYPDSRAIVRTTSR